MRDGHVCELADKGNLDGTLDRLLETSANHRIAMCAQ